MLILTALLACSPVEYAENPEITNEVEDWRDEIVYQVLVDRFANGDVNNDWNVTRDPTNLARYQGGDWQGLMDRVDYLEALGVTAVWISPVVRNVEEDAGVAGYHGYWTQSFRDTNPHFGDLATLRELVEVMHEHDILVIMDIVLNHVGQLFYYDINMNGQPDITDYHSTDGSDTVNIVTEWDPAYDSRGVQAWTSLGEAGPAPVSWVYMPELHRMPPEPPEFHNDSWYNQKGRVTDWSDLEQVVYGDFPGGLKDLATENPNVRDALNRAFANWITWTNIDGFRIDTVKHVEHDFWPGFCGHMREHAASIGKDQFFMFGESFDGDDGLIGSYTEVGMLDSVAYFSQKYQVFDDVFKYGQPTDRVATLYGQRPAHWGIVEQEGGIGVAPADLPVNFMDNHDVGRFLFDAERAGLEDPEAALRSALVFLFTTQGVPVLYYGTEQGFSGGNDPANREPLWWSDYDTDHDLFRFTADLIELRKGLAPLRRGDMAFTWTTDHTGGESDAGILAFERSYEGETALVVVNVSEDQASSTSYSGEAMAVSSAPGTELVEVFPGSEGSWTVSGDGTVEIEVGAREGLVLMAR